MEFLKKILERLRELEGKLTPKSLFNTSILREKLKEIGIEFDPDTGYYKFNPNPSTSTNQSQEKNQSKQTTTHQFIQQELEQLKTTIKQETDKIIALREKVDPKTPEKKELAEQIRVLLGVYEILETRMTKYFVTDSHSKEGDSTNLVNLIKTIEQDIKEFCSIKTEPIGKVVYSEEKGPLGEDIVSTKIYPYPRNTEEFLAVIKELRRLRQGGTQSGIYITKNFDKVMENINQATGEAPFTPVEKAKLNDLGKKLRLIANKNPSEDIIQKELSSLADYDDLLRKCYIHAFGSIAKELVEGVLAFADGNNLEEKLEYASAHLADDFFDNFPEEYIKQIEKEFNQVAKFLGLENDPDFLKTFLNVWVVSYKAAEKRKNKESVFDKTLQGYQKTVAAAEEVLKNPSAPQEAKVKALKDLRVVRGKLLNSISHIKRSTSSKKYLPGRQAFLIEVRSLIKEANVITKVDKKLQKHQETAEVAQKLQGNYDLEFKHDVIEIIRDFPIQTPQQLAAALNDINNSDITLGNTEDFVEDHQIIPKQLDDVLQERETPATIDHLEVFLKDNAEFIGTNDQGFLYLKEKVKPHPLEQIKGPDPAYDKLLYGRTYRLSPIEIKRIEKLIHNAITLSQQTDIYSRNQFIIDLIATGTVKSSTQVVEQLKTYYGINLSKGYVSNYILDKFCIKKPRGSKDNVYQLPRKFQGYKVDINTLTAKPFKTPEEFYHQNKNTPHYPLTSDIEDFFEKVYGINYHHALDRPFYNPNQKTDFSHLLKDTQEQKGKERKDKPNDTQNSNSGSGPQNSADQNPHSESSHALEKYDEGKLDQQEGIKFLEKIGTLLEDLYSGLSNEYRIAANLARLDEVLRSLGKSEQNPKLSKSEKIKKVLETLAELKTDIDILLLEEKPKLSDPERFEKALEFLDRLKKDINTLQFEEALNFLNRLEEDLNLVLRGEFKKGLQAIKKEISQEIKKLPRITDSTLSKKKQQKLKDRLTYLRDINKVTEKQIEGCSITSTPGERNKINIIGPIEEIESCVHKAKTTELDGKTPFDMMNEVFQKGGFAPLSKKDFHEINEKEEQDLSPDEEDFFQDLMEESPSMDAKDEQLRKNLKLIANENLSKGEIREKVLELADYHDELQWHFYQVLQPYLNDFDQSLSGVQILDQLSLDELDDLLILPYANIYGKEKAETLQDNFKSVAFYLGLDNHPQTLKDVLTAWFELTEKDKITLSEAAEKRKNKGLSSDDLGKGNESSDSGPQNSANQNPYSESSHALEKDVEKLTQSKYVTMPTHPAKRLEQHNKLVQKLRNIQRRHGLDEEQFKKLYKLVTSPYPKKKIIKEILTGKTKKEVEKQSKIFEVFTPEKQESAIEWAYPAAYPFEQGPNRTNTMPLRSIESKSSGQTTTRPSPPPRAPVTLIAGLGVPPVFLPGQQKRPFSVRARYWVRHNFVHNPVRMQKLAFLSKGAGYVNLGFLGAHVTKDLIHLGNDETRTGALKSLGYTGAGVAGFYGLSRVAPLAATYLGIGFAGLNMVTIAIPTAIIGYAIADEMSQRLTPFMVAYAKSLETPNHYCDLHPDLSTYPDRFYKHYMEKKPVFKVEASPKSDLYFTTRKADWDPNKFMVYIGKESHAGLTDNLVTQVTEDKAFQVTSYVVLPYATTKPEKIIIEGKTYQWAYYNPASAVTGDDYWTLNKEEAQAGIEAMNKSQIYTVGCSCRTRPLVYPYGLNEPTKGTQLIIEGNSVQLTGHADRTLTSLVQEINTYRQQQDRAEVKIPYALFHVKSLPMLEPLFPNHAKKTLGVRSD